MFKLSDMADNSLERTGSSDTSPLIPSSTTVVDRETPKIPRVSIFTCAVICILFTELCERLTFYGIIGNLVLFATEQDHLQLSPAHASILTYVFQGTCFTMPVLGGWLADSKAGKFSVILLSAIIYLIGTILLPFGSITNNKSEHSTWAANSVTNSTNFKLAVYITGLFLVAIGTGGIKANVSPFGAEQVSNRGPAAIQAFFSWFYWFINIGALLAFTFVVYVQQNVSFLYGNIIPAFSMILALIIFLAGKRSYNLRPPTGSVLTTTLRIMKEAIKRSRGSALHRPFVNHWLDRAKICFGGSYSNWEVEDVKKVYRLLPIFATFILYWTVYAQMTTSMIYQGEYMDINLGSFQIPIASLSLLDTLGVLLLIPVMDKLIYPLLRKCFDFHPSQLQRIGMGMLVATASMLCAGGLEWYRVENCCVKQDREGTEKNVSDMIIFYQIPQYTLIGLSEVFTSITDLTEHVSSTAKIIPGWAYFSSLLSIYTQSKALGKLGNIVVETMPAVFVNVFQGLELAYTEAPKSLQGVIMGVYLLTTGLGTYFGAALVAIINAVTEAINGKSGKWYPDHEYISIGHHFAYYFFLLAALMFLNFIVYIFVAVSFKVKKESANRSSISNGVMNDTEPPDLPITEEPDNIWTNSERSSKDSTQ